MPYFQILVTSFALAMLLGSSLNVTAKPVGIATAGTDSQGNSDALGLASKRPKNSEWIHKRCEGHRYGANGYEKDEDEAFVWCTKSAELGGAAGLSILGALYYHGEGVQQSYRDALFWYTLAANRDMPYAALGLFYMYLNGQGTEVDKVAAFMYLSRAANLGNNEAKAILADIEAESVLKAPSEEEVQAALRSKGVAKFAPVYPQAAQALSMEGYVVVSYCVDRDGQVTNLQVVESMPKGLFDAASISAAEHFRYVPELVNGTPVERHGVQNKFTFSLD